MFKRGLIVILFILIISLINISYAYNLDLNIVKDINKLNLDDISGYFMKISGFSTSPCTDIDNDGYGDINGIYGVSNNCDFNEGDCNDNDSSINPGASEICGDGIDQDCSGSDLQCVLVENPPLKIIYVDNQLFLDCIDTYSIANRDCSGTDGDAYDTIQQAMTIATPGTAIEIREGTYQENTLRFSSSGLSGQPIILEGYLGERPIIQERPDPWDGSGSQSVIIFGSTEDGYGDYIIRNLTIRNSKYGFLFAPPTTRIHDVKLENLEIYNMNDGTAIRTGANSPGVERLYIKGVTIYNTGGTEGGMDFKVNTANIGEGTGARNIIIRDTISHSNPHQASSGIITQNTNENFIYLNNRVYNNGEIGFTSKAGGYNIFINNIAYDQSKAGFYLRGPKKFGLPYTKSNYLLINNIAMTRHVMSGDQGALKVWEDAEVYAYNNHFISLEDEVGQWTGPASNIDACNPTVDENNDLIADCDAFTNNLTFYSKNNLFHKIADTYSLLFTEKDETNPFTGIRDRIAKRTYYGEGNLFSEPGTISMRVHNVRNWDCNQFLLNSASVDLTAFSIEEDEISSLCGIASFVSFTGDENILENLRPADTSLAINTGVPYGSGTNDYPQKVEDFLTAYNSFNDWTILTQAEKDELLIYIRTAYQRDLDGNLRDSQPDIGAYEFGGLTSSTTTTTTTSTSTTLPSTTTTALTTSTTILTSSTTAITTSTTAITTSTTAFTSTTTLSITTTTSSSSTSSTTVAILPQCNDGYDNDNDNLIDYPADPGCDSFSDNDETDLVITTTTTSSSTSSTTFGTAETTTTSSTSTTTAQQTGGTGSSGGGGSGGGRRLIVESCTEDWVCFNWLDCKPFFEKETLGKEIYRQERECIDRNNCETSLLKPETEKECEPITEEKKVVEKEKEGAAQIPKEKPEEEKKENVIAKLKEAIDEFFGLFKEDNVKEEIIRLKPEEKSLRNKLMDILNSKGFLILSIITTLMICLTSYFIIEKNKKR